MSRIALLSLVFLLPSPARAADPKADADLVRTAQSLFKELRSETLPNGLRVYLLPIKGSPVVTTMTAYKVGSGDEEKDQTGLSHYLEHLLFKGTDKLVPGDIDRATQRNGGSNNAYTNEDMTVYHFDFAADRWHTALEIEADRMRNVRIDEKHEFEQEKGAVIAELAKYEDTPGDLEYKAILTLLFPKASPYSHPVIGEERHVRGATAEIIKRHYDKWYHPNNAALVVVGGFEPDAAMAKIKALFGSIPKGDLPPRKVAPPIPERDGPVRKEFESKFDAPRLVMGFNTVAVGTPDDSVLDVIDTVLTDGRTSRLYRKLVEDERLFSGVNTTNNAGRHPGWFAVEGDLLKGKDRKKAEELIFAEFDKLAAEPVSDEELSRARRKIVASYVFAREGVHSLCDAIARTSMYPGGEDVGKFAREQLDRILTVSKADIQRVAKAYFTRKKAAIVWSIPKEGVEPANPDRKGGGKGFTPSLTLRVRQGLPQGAQAFSFKGAKRVVLPNGLTLLMLEDHRLPIVVARADIADVSLRETAEQNGVAVLTGGLLEEGTDKHTGKQIAQLIEDTGGSLGFSSSRAALKVLTPDADLGLGLMFECLTRPSFPKEAFDRTKEQQLAGIDDAATQPNTRASMAFAAAVYGAHPFGRPSMGTRAAVEKLTAADCKAFHALAFAPNFCTAVVVGDFKADEMAKKIEGLTKDWKKSDAPKPAPAAPKTTAFAEKIVSDPEASQVHVYLGHLGITRDNPDYYSLLVMDYVLGTGTGFTDRLSATLRDRQGLAYTVNANITSSAGKQPGTFTGYIGTFPDKYTWVRDGFMKEINRIRDEVPTPQEVDDARRYLTGSLPFRFVSLSDVAGELAAIERHGLGLDYPAKFLDNVEAVTPADVRRVAQKYLDPKAVTIVAVGPIDKDGKPLAGKKK